MIETYRGDRRDRLGEIEKPAHAIESLPELRRPVLEPLKRMDQAS